MTSVPSGALSSLDVARGDVSVSVVGVTNKDGTSSPSPLITRTVTGTWGIATAPVITAAIAVDSGNNVGLNTNDSLLLVFDQPVATPIAVTSPSELALLLSLTPPLPNTTVLTGAWSLGSTELIITFDFDTGVPLSGVAWLRWNVGQLSVSVLPSGNLTSANGQSPPSNATIVVAHGSWGDAVDTAVATPLSVSSVEVTVTGPSTAYNYSPATFVVAWSVVSHGVTAGIVSAPLPRRVADVDNALGGCPTATNATATDSAGVAYLCRSGCGVTLAVLASLPVADLSAAGRRGAGLTIIVPGLVTSASYALFVTSDAGDGRSLNPYVPTVPAVVTPLEPTITAVLTSTLIFGTAGGTAVRVVGQQLGSAASAVYVVLSNGAFTFTSPRCTGGTPGVAVECSAPAGVGVGHALSIKVDDQLSEPYVDVTFLYAAPSITALDMVDSDPDASGLDTAGGSVVVLHGANFGPATLADRAVTDVTYQPAVAATAAVPPVFRARNCTITMDHVSMRCVTAPGVGARLLWTIVVAGQSSGNPRTSYRAPIVETIAVLVGDGGGAPTTVTADSSPAALARLPTTGGETIVLRGRYFGPADSGVDVYATLT